MSFEPLPPKSRRTHEEIVKILDEGFRAPNHLGAALDAARGMAYWHAVAMRYRSMAADARIKWDSTPRRQCLESLDAMALDDTLSTEEARNIKPRRLER